MKTRLLLLILEQLDSVQGALMALTQAISDYKTKVDQAFSLQGKALDGLKVALDGSIGSLANIQTDQQTLLQRIIELQNTATSLSAEDKAALDGLAAQAQTMVDRTTQVATEAATAASQAAAIAAQVPDAPKLP